MNVAAVSTSRPFDLDQLLCATAPAYGGFGYTNETHQAKIGPIGLAVKAKQTVNVPAWAGFGAIMVACSHPPFMLAAPCGAR